MEKILTKNETNEILAMCKKAKVEVAEDKLMFVELGRDMFKGNKHILNKYFKNAEGQDCYYANLLAFRGVPNVTIYAIKKQLRADFGRNVSLAGYKYNPEHYRFSECHIQDEYEDELFRCKTTEEEQAEFEADRKARIEELDFNAVDSLLIVLTKAIKVRWLMLLHLEDIPSILNNAWDCYYKGVSCSISNAVMHAKIAEIRALLENKEVVEWLKTKPTDLMFDKYDYVYTYQKALRQLTSIRDTDLEYCRDLLDNPEDLYMEEIISNDYPETEPLYDNDSDESDDYLD